MGLDYYNLAMILGGIAILGVTWLPNLLADKPWSNPIIYENLDFSCTASLVDCQVRFHSLTVSLRSALRSFG